MDIEVNFTFREDDGDGFDGHLSYRRDKVEALEEICQFLTDGLRGSGFSYVENVGIEKDDGSMVFGMF